MFLIKVHERGTVPRNMVSITNKAKREVYREVGMLFHSKMRDRRFTRQHAREANYALRKGEDVSPSTKGWTRTYTGRKVKMFGHRNPLEFSGKTRNAVRTANISATSRSVRIAYPGARVLNFRHPKSQVYAAQEFRTITEKEARTMARLFDSMLSRRIKQNAAAAPVHSTTIS